MITNPRGCAQCPVKLLAASYAFWGLIAGAYAGAKPLINTNIVVTSRPIISSLRRIGRFAPNSAHDRAALPMSSFLWSDEVLK